MNGQIEVEGLEFRYSGGPPVLTGADLQVPPGTRLAVLGANGSGKSTLLRCLSGALRPTAGRITVGGRELRHTRTGLREHRHQVQLITQDPDDQLFSASVREDVSFGPVNQGLTDDEVRARCDEALTLLAATHLAARPTHQLSFGERKRVAIAGAVAMRPDVLVLDEPTAGLDPAAGQEATAALARLHDRGTTLVMATHDVDLALAWADQVAVLVGGLVRQGPPEKLLDDDTLLIQGRLRRPWVLSVAARLRALGVLGQETPVRDEPSLLAALG
ncbi:ATP-binding cassette domain-containing protein [Kineosporia sp. NBRC 101731]|uniref:energy-coupling factor ABC transporter ATP-binding protein n=1 Tax=Kineosporia sp. NBRC 101731 TaxID=3032199 RepID=UPI0024A2F5F1|nr:ATP-binding cassette domain-containing protein [Kineosporia sp. NBRC 101731]GLY32730.1 putative ABC transporter ATP-binding protein [Kineosporia sp. NBRC 101731]